MLKSSPVHVKVISPSKAAAHETSMFFHKKDSTLIQFSLDIKPLIFIGEHNYSPKIERKPDKQDNCDNYIEFD